MRKFEMPILASAHLLRSMNAIRIVKRLQIFGFDIFRSDDRRVSTTLSGSYCGRGGLLQRSFGGSRRAANRYGYKRLTTRSSTLDSRGQAYKIVKFATDKHVDGSNGERNSAER